MTVNKNFFNKPKEKLAHPTHAFVEAQEEQPEEAPVSAYKPVHRKRETKSKRVNLLIKPSLYEALAAKAETMDLSINEAFNLAIAAYVRRK